MVKLRFISLLIFVGFFLNLLDTAFACRCHKRAVEEYYTDADMVFSGTVEIIAWISFNPAYKDIESATTEVTVAPIKIWKGNQLTKVTIYSEPGSCTMRFNEGKDYLIFAKERDDGFFETNICMGTSDIDYATEDIEKLDVLMFSADLEKQNDQ